MGLNNKSISINMNGFQLIRTLLRQEINAYKSVNTLDFYELLNKIIEKNDQLKCSVTDMGVYSVQLSSLIKELSEKTEQKVNTTALSEWLIQKMLLQGYLVLLGRHLDVWFEMNKPTQLIKLIQSIKERKKPNVLLHAQLIHTYTVENHAEWVEVECKKIGNNMRLNQNSIIGKTAPRLYKNAQFVFFIKKQVVGKRECIFLKKPAFISVIINHSVNCFSVSRLSEDAYLFAERYCL